MPNRPDDLVVSVEPRNDGGASPLATGPSRVEPVPVSPLRASVPSAMAWYPRDVDPEDAIFLDHGVAYILPAGEGFPVHVKRVGKFAVGFHYRWSSWSFGVEILRAGLLVQFGPTYFWLAHIQRQAQAIEARRAETGTGSVHESAVVEDHAPNTDRNPHQEDTTHDTD